MSKLTFVFRNAPHATSSGREGVDAVLAVSAYCDDIAIVFIDSGVGHLVTDQNTMGILAKDYAPMFKLFELYDIDQIYVCRHSLLNLGMEPTSLFIDAKLCDRQDIAHVIQSSNKVLTF